MSNIHKHTKVKTKTKLPEKKLSKAVGGGGVEEAKAPIAKEAVWVSTTGKLGKTKRFP